MASDKNNLIVVLGTKLAISKDIEAQQRKVGHCCQI